MKKKVLILISLFLVASLAVGLWFWYHHRKSTDDLPALASLSQMTEEEITDILAGYHLEQLHAVWGEPEGTLFGMFGEIWTLDGEKEQYLYVYFNSKAIAEYARLRVAE